jgi:segregation and condensation protein A
MYRIQLSDFEGPLDLLLFFIKRDELNIYDIPISKITEDFMGYLSAMKSLNLEVASEFIYMASTLMSIKVKMLLPKPVSDDENSEEFDPRAELVEKLLDYKRFKEMSEHLQVREENRRQYHARQYFEDVDAPVMDEFNDPLKKPTLFELILAYKHAIDNRPKQTIHQVSRIPVTISEQTEHILTALDDKIQVSYRELVRQYQDSIYYVVTFLAILELCKNTQISVVTKDDYNDFWISKKQFL